MDISGLLFSIKKGISLLFIPSGMVFILLFLGFFIWPMKRKRGMAKTFFFMAFLIYTLCSSAPVANILVKGLESHSFDGYLRADTSGIDTLAVLCGGMYQGDGRPVIDRLTPYTRLRLLKAWELCRHGGIKTLVIVGGCSRPDGRCPVSEARLGLDWLKELGLPSGLNIILEEKSRDTEENIKGLQGILGQRPFFLVTSAAHMPRVMWLCQRYSLKPVPVPCNFLAGKYHWTPWDIWPNPLNLAKSDLAIHEYIGILWNYVKYLVGRGLLQH